MKRKEKKKLDLAQKFKNRFINFQYFSIFLAPFIYLCGSIYSQTNTNTHRLFTKTNNSYCVYLFLIFFSILLCVMLVFF